MIEALSLNQQYDMLNAVEKGFGRLTGALSAFGNTPAKIDDVFQQYQKETGDGLSMMRMIRAMHAAAALCGYDRKTYDITKDYLSRLVQAKGYLEQGE